MLPNLYCTVRTLGRSSFLVLGIWISASSCPLCAQASDLVDTGRLGARGVIFELPPESYGIIDAQGIGDFNGDGLDDIALSVKDPADGTFPVVLLYGKQGLTGRHNLQLDGGLPGSLVLRGLSALGFYLAESVNGL